jgi:hypothetical protein
MGPLQVQMNAAYNLEWAHFSYQEMLPVISNGPITAASDSCL